jgi:hypothetical protein
MLQDIEEFSGRGSIGVRTAWGTVMHGVLMQVHAMEGCLETPH